MTLLSAATELEMTPLYTVALLSGLFQVLGYLVYIHKSVRHEVEPNATTWLMFAYGTGLLAVLEYDHDAKLTMLFLPVACAIFSLRVAAICYANGTLRIPDSWFDRFAILTDLSLTAAYVSTWFATQQGVISEVERQQYTLLFLVLTNMSTIVSFLPIVRGTIESPRNEHPLAWLIWTVAYSCLAYVTYLEEGTYQTVFMLYPATGIALHGLVGLLSLRRFTAPKPRP